jgi:hypothetical protein
MTGEIGFYLRETRLSCVIKIAHDRRCSITRLTSDCTAHENHDKAFKKKEIPTMYSARTLSTTETPLPGASAPSLPYLASPSVPLNPQEFPFTVTTPPSPLSVESLTVTPIVYPPEKST